MTAELIDELYGRITVGSTAVTSQFIPNQVEWIKISHIRIVLNKLWNWFQRQEISKIPYPNELIVVDWSWIHLKWTLILINLIKLTADWLAIYMEPLLHHLSYINSINSKQIEINQNLKQERCWINYGTRFQLFQTNK